MKLANIDWGFVIDFEQNQVVELYIENVHYFCEIMQDFNNQLMSEQGKLVLSIGDDICKIKKDIEVITDYFTLNPNNTKVTKRLLEQLCETVYEDSERVYEFMNAYNKFMDELIYLGPFELERNYETPLINILKTAGISIQNDFDTLLERIVCYIDTIHEYLDIKLFVLINLNCYLTTDELKQLYEFCIMKNINILIINSCTCISELIEMDGVRRYIIDKDLCEIL